MAAGSSDGAFFVWDTIGNKQKREKSKEHRWVWYQGCRLGGWVWARSGISKRARNTCTCGSGIRAVGVVAPLGTSRHDQGGGTSLGISRRGKRARGVTSGVGVVRGGIPLGNIGKEQAQVGVVKAQVGVACVSQWCGVGCGMEKHVYGR